MSNAGPKQVDSTLEHIQQLIRDGDDSGLYRLIEANACDENLVLPWYDQAPIAYVVAYLNFALTLGELIEKKADLSYRDKQGRCILYQTIFAMSYQSFLVLLQAGVEVNSVTNSGVTPLMAAARYTGQPFKGDFITPLVALGADMEARDENGMTALSHALSQGIGNLDIIELLLKLGARPSLKDVEQSRESAIYEVLKPYFANVEMLNAASDIPLVSGRVSGPRL